MRRSIVNTGSLSPSLKKLTSDGKYPTRTGSTVREEERSGLHGLSPRNGMTVLFSTFITAEG